MNTKAVLAAAASAAVCVASAAMTVTTNETVVTVDATSTSTLSDALLSPDVTRLVKTGTGRLQFYPNAASTYTGGTLVSAGQLRIKRADAVGTGDIEIADGAQLIVDGDVTLANKVRFQGDSSYAASLSGSTRLTLKSIAAASYLGSVRLGRDGNGADSCCRLSLTDGDSEPIGRFNLSGAIDFWIDGGTVKAGDGAKSPFFSCRTTDTPAVNVSTAGFTFDASSGADVTFGQPLVFSKETVTNVLENVYPENYSFEQSGGWNFSKNSSSEQGKICSNGSDFDKGEDGDWGTTNGLKYAMVRRYTTLSSINGVTISTPGLWRVAGEVGCRPLQSYSLDIETSIIVDDKTVGTIPAVTKKEDRHGFKRFETPPFLLEAGPHSLALSLSNSNSSRSLNFDVLHFERVEIENVVGPFEKSGKGRLRIENLDYDGALTVSDGELALASPSLGGTAQVASGACLALQTQGGADLGSAAVSVASGGTLAFSSLGENLISNGSFEADGAKTNIVNTQPSKWSIKKTQSTSHNDSGSGLQGNGGNVSAGGPTTPSGSVTAYLREYTKLSQNVTVPTNGTYRISWLQSCRTSFSSFGIPLTLAVDGVAAAEPAAFTSSYPYTPLYADVELEAGSHDISFTTGAQTSTSDGAMVFVDDVQVRKIGESGAVSGGAISLASGAEIRLDCLDKVRVESLKVDGVEVNGGKVKLRRAGVTVSGTGDIFVGEQTGSVILFR